MKKILSAMLAFVLMLCASLPALAVLQPNLVLAGVDMYPGDYLRVGEYTVSDFAPLSGTGYAHLSADGKTLTLNNFDNMGKTSIFNFSRNALLIYKNTNLVLVGTNTLTSTSAESDGIRAIYGHLTIDENSTGSLTVTADYAIYQSGMSDFTMRGGELKLNASKIAIFCNYFDMSGGELQASNTSNSPTLKCSHLLMTGGTAELTGQQSGSNVVEMIPYQPTCTVPVAQNVVFLSKNSSFFIDTAEANAALQQGRNPGRRTIRLGLLKEDVVVPDAPAASVPTTGDNAMIALWAVLAMASAAAMICISRRGARVNSPR